MDGKGGEREVGRFGRSKGTPYTESGEWAEIRDGTKSRKLRHQAKGGTRC